jgi:ABC-type Fe3+-hydroxamate transport system substrate-binding protein
MTRVLVCGGRDFHYQSIVGEIIESVLYEEFWKTNTGSRPWLQDILICGMARGADLAAYSWAQKAGMPVEKYVPNWDKHGRAAGIIRNKEMLEEGKPDLVIAFPGGRGTDNMVSIALKAGVPVHDYRS